MCLSRIFTYEEMEEWLADKPEVIEVWKLVREVSCEAYIAPAFGIVYEDGLNSVDKALIQVPNKFKYYAGFHFFTKPLKRYFEPEIYRMYYTQIKCLVKKEWITAIGIEHWEDFQIAIVASQAIFPHYPETEARLEDVDCYPEETGPVLVRV
ncbi:MAG: hypothetical protein ACYS67_17945 [Planctomycetota bacterium]|jgi:hypothetical protein